jgi:hypothetical protein
MSQLQLNSYISPLYFLDNIYPYLAKHFSVGYDLQKIYVPIEVSSPGGKFDTSQDFFCKINEFQNLNLIFWHSFYYTRLMFLGGGGVRVTEEIY